MKRFIFLSLFGILMAQSAYAETVQGVIVNMNPVTDTLSIKRTDISPNAAIQELYVKVSNDTLTKNFTSLDQLKIDHKVKMDVTQGDAPVLMDAQSIEIVDKAQK